VLRGCVAGARIAVQEKRRYNGCKGRNGGFAMGPLPTPSMVESVIPLARGSAKVEGIGTLHEGDAVRITEEGGRHVYAVPDAASVAEIIVWEMHADAHQRGTIR
jgi:hypothetical protein